MTEKLKRTALYDAHLKAGAKMVPFGGWDMPVQYIGLKAEHQAVRESVGVFDVSHMGQFWVRGNDALKFLQFITTNDVSKLKPKRAQYNWLPNDKGGLVDDIYIYMAAENQYLFVVNAGNIDKDWQHLLEQAKNFDIQLTNDSDTWALLAVQGPKAAEILNKHTEQDLITARKNSFFEGNLFDLPVMFACTGYTGEDGYEIFIKSDKVNDLWDKILALEIQPVGLGARDTLRLEAGFPLYGHEFSEEIHPLSSHYAWVVKDKEFFGKEKIKAEPTKKLIGIKLDKVPVREGYSVFVGEDLAGVVTSGSISPTLGYPIAMALIDKKYIENLDKSEIFVEVRGKKHLAYITNVPFYKVQ